MPPMGQRAVLLLALMLVSGLASEAARCAQMPSAVQYALHCSGCHGLQATASQRTAIADLNEAWRYAATAAGRNYLISVPGVATSGLSDDGAAARLNRVISIFGQDEAVASFTRFTAVEVAAGRRHIASDALHQRLRLMTRWIAAVG